MNILNTLLVFLAAEHSPVVVSAAQWSGAAISFIVLVSLILFLRYLRRRRLIGTENLSSVWILTLRLDDGQTVVKGVFREEKKAKQTASRLDRKEGGGKVWVCQMPLK